MASYNKIIMIGNLTRDPQLSYLPSNTPVCEIGLAVNHKWKSQDGNTNEKVCFIDCKSFGKQAETLNQHVNKGDPLMIEGRLEFDQWEAQDGQKRSKHRVFIERFTFMGGQKENQQSTPPPQAPAPPQAPQPPQQQSPPPQEQKPPGYYDDVPF